jgi:hypothetical protein
LERSNKKNTTLYESLSHTSGWIPYISHQNFIKKRNGKIKKSIVRDVKSKRFSTQINEELFLKNTHLKKVFKRIKNSKVNPKNNYNYSGLFFFYVPSLVNKISGLKFDRFFNEKILKDKNITLLFNPTKNFNKEFIVPTEYDSIFRQTLVHGFVHDEAASFMGGISGNAGLFGNAESIGVLLADLEPDNSGLLLMHMKTHQLEEGLVSTNPIQKKNMEPILVQIYQQKLMDILVLQEQCFG